MELFNKNKKLFDSKLIVDLNRNLNKKREIIYKESFIVKKHFLGASPPEIFVGRYNYPNVNAGILSPNFFENVEELSIPEIWHERKFSIEQVLEKRRKLVYGRFKTKIKGSNFRSKFNIGNKFLSLMQELANAYKPVSTEFFLKNLPKNNFEINRFSPIITNQAQLEYVRLQENPKIKRKVDYLTSDDEVKASVAVNELYNYGINISSINKILSAGLLGLKTSRKLVPTRWSITAVDDGIAKNLLDKIRYYSEINDILVFNSEYNGNHYEILLLPGNYSFEVIEAEIKEIIKINGLGFNSFDNFDVKFWQDYERFHGRRDYANEVIGAYYANRLALCEYLERIKKQATAIFFREIFNYYAPLGVGILRETCREAFSKSPEKFDSLEEAFEVIQSRLKINTDIFREKSVLLKEYGKQKKLREWF